MKEVISALLSIYYWFKTCTS